MNEEGERGKLMVIQLACGHFQRFRGLLHCPCENDLVLCTQCPESNGPVIVRISPRKSAPYISTCSDCNFRRKTHGRLAAAKIYASNHASRKSHLVITAHKGAEVYRSDWRQRQLSFEEPPF